MVIHYVYVLHYKGKPFYVGCSVNPVKRMYDHFGVNSFPKVHAFMKKIKKVSDVTICIVQKFTTNRSLKCKKCTRIEQVWIRKYLNRGHNLVNGLVASYTLPGYPIPTYIEFEPQKVNGKLIVKTVKY